MDDVIVHHLLADKGTITFDLGLGRVERARTKFVSPDTLVMTGARAMKRDRPLHSSEERYATKSRNSEGDRIASIGGMLLTGGVRAAMSSSGIRSADPSGCDRTNVEFSSVTKAPAAELPSLRVTVVSP